MKESGRKWEGVGRKGEERGRKEGGKGKERGWKGFGEGTAMFGVGDCRHCSSGGYSLLLSSPRGASRKGPRQKKSNSSTSVTNIFDTFLPFSTFFAQGKKRAIHEA